MTKNLENLENLENDAINAKNAVINAENFCFFCNSEIFLNFWKIIVLSLNDCNTINLRFFRLFFAMHQNLRHFLYRASENLRWPKVKFTSINLSWKIWKSRENWKTGGKVRCLLKCLRAFLNLINLIYSFQPQAKLNSAWFLNIICIYLCNLCKL